MDSNLSLAPISEQEQTCGQSSSAAAAQTAVRHLSFSTVILPAILLLAYVAQCAWFIRTQSLTFDEPIDILSGLEQWRTGQYSGGQGMNDNPPLARLLCTLPAMNSRFQVGDKTAPNIESVAWHNSDFDSFAGLGPNPEVLAWHTRPVDAMLGVVLGLLLWLAARSLYSVSAANFVLALFSFSPALIAHFSLAATSDGVVTLMLFATVFQLYRWYRDRSWPQTVLLGLVLGGLLLTKASSLPFFVLVIGLMLVLNPDSISIYPAEWNWRKALTALLISFLIVWGAYRFHVSRITLATSGIQTRVDVPNRAEPILHRSPRTLHISVPVPAFEFLQGLAFQFRHNEGGGHYGYFLGRSYRGGSKLYFPVVILLKWPIIVLLLFACAVGLMFSGRIALPRAFALWAIFPMLYFMLATLAKLNLGERYILPIYPFVLLLCGSLWQFTKGRRVVLVLLLLALVVHVGDVLRYAPDYLSYFNPSISAASSYKFLSDSNVDWGEGLIALRHYQEAHQNVPIHLAYFGSVAPATYGIRATPVMPNERVSGTVIVSANFLTGQTLPDPNGYRWVLQYPRKSILNHSLYVFEVPNEVNQP